jgi:hypothetical protein
MILVVLYYISSSSSTTNTKTITSKDSSPIPDAIRDALSSLKDGKTFVPNYVPPIPADETSLLKTLVDLFIDALEAITVEELFEKFLKKLLPEKANTWKGLFGNNVELNKKFELSARKKLSNVPSYDIQVKVKNANQLVHLGSNNPARLIGKTAAQIQADAVVTGADSMISRVGIRFAAFLGAGPLDAALLAVAAAGQVMDMENVNGLQNWENQTTNAFSDIKVIQDHNFAQDANDAQVNLPMIAGPLDSGSDPDTYANVVKATMVELVVGSATIDNPKYQNDIYNVQIELVKNFVKSTTSNPTSDLRSNFSLQMTTTITNEYCDKLSNAALYYLCTNAGGTFLNGKYCSHPESKCNLTDSEWNDFMNRKATREYNEWRDVPEINGKACTVQPYEVRQACSVGRRDINGSMKYNRYDTTTGRCYNTKDFCDAYGINFNGSTCYQDATQKVFSLIFGNTIVQGVAMVDNTVNRSIILFLETGGPAGKYIAKIYARGKIAIKSIVCAFCTTIDNQFRIVKDLVTGDFDDIGKAIKEGIRQVTDAVKAVISFLNAIFDDIF